MNDQTQTAEAAIKCLRELKRPIVQIYGINESGNCTCGNPDCTNPGKHPIGINGVYSGTMDPNLVDFWIEQDPRSNFATATGGGIYTLDADTGKGGLESLNMIECETGPIPHTPTVRTGGRGLHLYFCTSEPLSNSAGTIAPGIDGRGEGGMAIIPPSRHLSGNRYEWIHAPWDVPLAPMPEKLLALVKNAGAHRSANLEIPADIEIPQLCGGDTTSIRVRQALFRVAAGQGRNTSGYWLACRLRDAGVEQNDAVKAMLLYTNHVPAGTHDYKPEEALRSLQSAYSTSTQMNGEV